LITIPIKQRDRESVCVRERWSLSGKLYTGRNANQHYEYFVSINITQFFCGFFVLSFCFPSPLKCRWAADRICVINSFSSSLTHIIFLPGNTCWWYRLSYEHFNDWWISLTFTSYMRAIPVEATLHLCLWASYNFDLFII